MHFLLMPQGSSGDVNPLLGIGRELARRGHEVTVATCGYFAETVQRAGLRFVEQGTKEQYLTMVHHPDLWHPTRGPQTVFGNPDLAQGLRDGYRLVTDFHAAHPEGVVVGATLAVSGRVALETHPKLKFVTAHLQPSVFRSMIDPPVLGNLRIPDFFPRWTVRAFFWWADRIIDRVLQPSLTTFRHELGLPPQQRYLKDWLHSPVLTLGLFPDWYASAPDWPASLKLTGFVVEDAAQGLSAELSEWLQQGQRPIVFSFGSAMAQGRELFANAIAVCQKLNRRGLLLSQFPEQLPTNLPPNVRWERYVSFTDLLPHAAVFVHHGGVGSTARGLLAGVPQVITPLSHDQFDNALRVQRLNAGTSVRPRFRWLSRFAAAISANLNDAARKQRCREIARQNSLSGAMQAADLLTTM